MVGRKFERLREKGERFGRLTEADGAFCRSDESFDTAWVMGDDGAETVEGVLMISTLDSQAREVERPLLMTRVDTDHPLECFLSAGDVAGFEMPKAQLVVRLRTGRVDPQQLL